MEEEIIKESDSYYCRECETLCSSVYEQELSCECEQEIWENKKYGEKDYPAKWTKVKIRIYTIPKTQGELLPCSFCGGEAEYVEKGNNNFDVQCERDSCFLQYGANYSVSKEYAKELWNKRTR